MSFFQGINTQQKDFEASGSFELLPENTNFLAAIEQISNKQSGYGKSIINAKWRVIKPEKFANRVFFQNLKVFDADANKASKARQMLSAMAANAGGRLFTEMQSRNEQSPSDQSLQTMTNFPMVVQLGIWHIKAEEAQDGVAREGNFLRKVSPVNRAAQTTNPQQQGHQPQTMQPVAQMIDSEIPF